VDAVESAGIDAAIRLRDEGLDPNDVQELELGVSLDDFTDEAVQDPRKFDLASRVRCVADEERDRIFPNQFPAVLRTRLKGGELREARVSHSRGGPENSLSDGQLETKFHVNAGRVLAEERVGGLWETLGSLGEAESVGEVARLARIGG